MDEEIEDLEEISPGHYEVVPKERAEKKEEKELTPAELYNKRQREIMEDMKVWHMKPGDRVLVDEGWVPGSVSGPVFLSKGRIMGFNPDGTVSVQISGNGGNFVPVHRDAVKQNFGYD